MPAFSGSFSGNGRMQTAVSLSDKSNHEMNLAEIVGTQKSSDEKWNNSAITYWGITDTVEGKGTQQGYFVNDRGGGSRNWGTFEGKVAASGDLITVEGTWQFTGGSQEFSGLTGKGTFKTKMTSPGDVEATWQGAYELATVTQAAG